MSADPTADLSGTPPGCRHPRRPFRLVARKPNSHPAPSASHFPDALGQATQDPGRLGPEGFRDTSIRRVGFEGFPESSRSSCRREGKMESPTCLHPIIRATPRRIGGGARIPEGPVTRGGLVTKTRHTMGERTRESRPYSSNVSGDPNRRITATAARMLRDASGTHSFPRQAIARGPEP
jgi:hypothetical protein